MNKFELFSMIFYALDMYYEDNPSEELGKFLGAMSPFTFKEVDSADSAVYEGFCEAVKKGNVEIDESYDMAKAYLKSLVDIDLYTPFCETIREEEWIEGCKDYLSKPHKGQS